jgi:hypothetical protein
VPENAAAVIILIPDVELKFCSSSVMEGPVIKRCVSAEDLVTRPLLQSFQLHANNLKLADGMGWGELVKLSCDGVELAASLSSLVKLRQ